MMLEAMTSSLAGLFSGYILVYLVLGVLLGLVVGTLPGLGGTAGLSLLVPFVFGMETAAALAMMTGLLAVVTTGDTFASVLMGIPGSSSSQATVLDGFPLAKEGKGARALAAAFSASMIGGVIGALVLTVAVLVARPIILAFGTGEMLLLVILGLTMVCVLSGRSLTKGIIACGLGMLCAAVGSAPGTGEMRLTFGSFYLMDGLPLVAVALGIFAIPEIVDLLRRSGAIARNMELGRGWLQGLKDTIQHRWIVIRCSILGCLIGTLPGIAGSVVDWIAYGSVVQSSKNRDRFGRGDIRGVIGPESSNNACTGGSLVPTLIFGIPGSGNAAIFLGGMILLGIQPGTSMLQANLDITYSIIWSLAIANIIGAGLCFMISGQVARLTQIPYVYLAPFMLMMVFFAAFQSSRQMGDIFVLVGIGLFAVYMRRFGFPRPAFLIGFVLQLNFERYLYQTLQFYSIGDLAQRPLIWVLVIVIVTSLYFGLKYRPTHSTEGDSLVVDSRGAVPQIIFLAGCAGAAVAVIIASRDLYFIGQVYPIAAATLVLFASLVAVASILLHGANSAVMFDAEYKWSERQLDLKVGMLHYVLWIIAFGALIYLAGFLPATVIFFTVFLFVKTTARWWQIMLMAAGAVLFTAALSRMLSLRLPSGVVELQFIGSWIGI